MSGIDPNTVMAGVGTALIKDFFVSIRSRLNERFLRSYEKLFPGFEKHLIEVHNRVSIAKVICAQDSPVDFRRLYVSSDLRQGRTEISEDALLARMLEGERIVVNSQGGSGKTFLLRSFWLRLFDYERVKIPIFVELRGLNRFSDIDLEVFIRATAFQYEPMSVDAFRSFCEEGVFCFLFDGFDEVEYRHRDALESQILEISRRYADCALIVTSRPAERFSSWLEFRSYSCLPFTFQKFKELIEKAPFDSKARKNFLKLADSNFFEKHEDFLSNPLLALMMLMTFRDHAEIPNRLATFYENCFLTLYSKHDALKEQFSRNKKLDQNEFRRLFACFCFLSYLRSKQDFTVDEMYFFIEKAAAHTQCSLSIEEILHEFLETINLVYQEGMKYWFVHRSFQEYFAAYYATKVLIKDNGRVFDVFAKRHGDATLLLSYQLHPDLVTKDFLLPSIDEFRARFEPFLGKARLPRYALTSFLGFECRSVLLRERAEVSQSTWGIDNDLLSFVRDCEKLMQDNDRELSYNGFLSDYHHALDRWLNENRARFSKDGSQTFEIVLGIKPSALVFRVKDIAREGEGVDITAELSDDLIKQGELLVRDEEVLLRDRLNLVDNWLRKKELNVRSKEASLAEEFGL